MIAGHVVIQGGGIGGLIAATALAQRGVEVDVVEHRPAASVLGGRAHPARERAAGDGLPMARSSRRQPPRRRLFHGATIVTIADGVTVTFRGESTPADGRYDLLLGFDGVRSVIRRHLFGAKYEPQLTGFSVWRVSLPRPAELERTVFAFAGPVKATMIPLWSRPRASRSTGSPDQTSLGRCRACCRGSAVGSASCAT